MKRRTFIKSTAAAALAIGFGPDFWRAAYAVPAVDGPGPYGPLEAADANGLRLPAGFSSRIVARSGEGLPGGYKWHDAPDGAGCFPAPDGGWVYVSNSESGGDGGAGALRFGPDGTVTDAYRVLSGTTRNCAGGVTPWGTWLSCEETGGGQVYECDPFTKGGDKGSQVRPGLGSFSHEAAAVDPLGKKVYLTEDDKQGRLYRFTPASYPDLKAGQLEVARREGGDSGTLAWVAAEPGKPARGGDSSAFAGGEGVWYDEGWMYFVTKHDNKVWALELATQRYEVIYSPDLVKPGILTGVDNLFVSPFSGDVFVAEDGGSMDLVLLAAPVGLPTAPRVAAPFVTIDGQKGSEITGPAMSPDGRRMYLSSQRGTNGSGITYEISGPFRNTRLVPNAAIPEFPLVAAGAVSAAAVIGGTLLTIRSRAIEATE